MLAFFASKFQIKLSFSLSASIYQMLLAPLSKVRNIMTRRVAKDPNGNHIRQYIVLYDKIAYISYEVNFSLLISVAMSR